MDLYRLLQKANLSSYYDAFLSNGGDDVHQLLEATEEELQEIMRVVDMANKPLHVIRLKKTLNDIRSRPEKYSLPSNGALFNDSQRNYSFQATTTGGDWSSSSATANFHGTNSQVRGIPVNLLPNATLTENERMNIEMAADDLVKAIPEYPIKDHSPSRKGEAGLYEVIKMSADHASRVPAIYRYSAIYGRFNRPRKTGKAMNHHEVAVNEAAAQLCLRMPSLLSRREDLYPLSRQVVKIAEESWKSQQRYRSHKKRRNCPTVMAISSEFASYHQNNPQAGYIQVQEKIELVKNQLCDMIGQMDKLKLAFRVAKNGSGGASMAEIQKEIDALCAVQQTKISEVGRYVLELRKFRSDLHLPQPTPTRMIDNKNNLNSIINNSNLLNSQHHQQQQQQQQQLQQQNFNSNHNNSGLISLTPVQSGNATNIFATTAGGLTAFPGLTQVKSDTQNATFLITNNPNRQDGSNNLSGQGNNNLLNSNTSIVTLPPGVMALNVGGNSSNNGNNNGGHNMTSYVANNNVALSAFPNFSVFTNLGQKNNQGVAQQGELIKIENGHPNGGNVYQAYIA